MNERQAREVTLLEAFETAQPASPSWGDEERRWADRVALEAVGSTAPAPLFIAERARHAIHRLLPRERVAARWLQRPTRRGAWVATIVVVAVVLGLLADPIGGSQRINLLTPPFWGLLLWNVVVYGLLIFTALASIVRRRPPKQGPLRRAAAALLRVGQRMVAPAAGSSVRRAIEASMRVARPTSATGAARSAAIAPLAGFATLWSRRTAGLASLRAQTFLHAGAAALAAGLIASLYLRGLLLDYRVGWESTFLSAPTVHAVLATALAPAAALAHVALPDEAAFAALQTLPDRRSAGAPAALWIHLLAITMALVVVLPRIALALGCAARLDWLGRRFALPWNEPYFQRLARLQRGAAAEVDVFPYAHTPTPQAALGLHALVSEAFGPKASVRIAPTIAFGAEDDAAVGLVPASSATHVLMLCDLGATPEFETHGRCANQLAQGLPPGAVFALLLDESSFRRRFAGLRERLLQRRAAWSDLAARSGGKAAFADLEAPLDPDVVAALHASFAEAPAQSPTGLSAGPRVPQA